MRNRHIPRVCRRCQAPMASAAATCWRCGVDWAEEAPPRTSLRLVPSGDAAGDRSAREAVTPAAAARG